MEYSEKKAARITQILKIIFLNLFFQSIAIGADPRYRKISKVILPLRQTVRDVSRAKLLRYKLRSFSFYIFVYMH